MSTLEKQAARAVVSLSENERDVVISHMKKEGIYKDSEPISWNVKNLLFRTVGLPVPMNDLEKKRQRGRDLREKARQYEELLKKEANKPTK